MSSLSLYVPVVEFEDWLEKTGGSLGAVYYLQGYKEGWKNGKFEEKFDLRECLEEPTYEQGQDDLWRGQFFFYEGVAAQSFSCLSVQGHTSVIAGWLAGQEQESVMLDRAEQLLHDWFGDVEYWGARRSMRFADRLVERATRFRKEELGSEGIDGTEVSKDWREENGEGGRSSRGGNYACVHLRRGDYSRGRGSRAPTVEGAARQLAKVLEERELEVLFVATDAEKREWKELVEELGKGIRVVRFEPLTEELQLYKDGGVAIIDQVKSRKLPPMTFPTPGCVQPRAVLCWQQGQHFHV